MRLLSETAAAWGLALHEGQLAQLEAYAEELRRWNARLNLTAVDDERGIAVRHFLDSLRCALSWGAPPARLADVGSGAGFPGLPLKVLRPELELTLVESIGKKAEFLRHVARELGLEGVTVLAARAEEVGRDPHQRESHDVVTARAVAELRTLCEYCLPLCRVGGRLLAPKGPQGEAEALAAGRALAELGGSLAAVEDVELPGEPRRTLVVIDKAAPTPERYPRPNGAPSRRPL
jgi:16S rRNA (guanine527-N7)-methyltransferase